MGRSRPAGCARGLLQAFLPRGPPRGAIRAHGPGPAAPRRWRRGTGPRPVHAVPWASRPQGRRVVSPPLAREVPPPPTLLSPRATNCAQDIGGTAATSFLRRGRRQIYCGQQTRNSDERAQERDKDQGEPASERTAPPHTKANPPPTAEQAPARTHRPPPRPDHPLPLTRTHRKNDRLRFQREVSPLGRAQGLFCKRS